MVSIIIPLYNKEKYIAATLQSVLLQTFYDFEIIVVNDGSTDGSVEEVKKFADKRIRIVDQENSGVSSARNRGAEEAKGEWLFFLDADDPLLPNGLDVLVRLMSDYPGYDIYTGNYVDSPLGRLQCCCSQTGVCKNAAKFAFLGKMTPRTGNTLIKKELFESLGGYSTLMNRYEDLDLIIRMLDTGVPVVYSKEPVFTYKTESVFLSKKKGSLSSEFCYYVTMSSFSSSYCRLFAAFNVYISIRDRLSMCDYGSVVTLFRKNLGIGWLYILVAPVYRKMSKIVHHYFAF